jgi:predicted membrane chloride channel (bestrophin family)
MEGRLLQMIVLDYSSYYLESLNPIGHFQNSLVIDEICKFLEIRIASFLMEDLRNAEGRNMMM